MRLTLHTGAQNLVSSVVLWPFTHTATGWQYPGYCGDCFDVRVAKYKQYRPMLAVESQDTSGPGSSPHFKAISFRRCRTRTRPQLLNPLDGFQNKYQPCSQKNAGWRKWKTPLLSKALSRAHVDSRWINYPSCRFESCSRYHLAEIQATGKRSLGHVLPLTTERVARKRLTKPPDLVLVEHALKKMAGYFKPRPHFKPLKAVSDR